MMNNEKILYTKYSNDRMAPFRIATQIIEQGGKKIVRKSAMEESARSHILAIKKHEAALSDMFVGTKFKVNKIVASGDDFVDFEYLEGTSYDQILDGYLKNKDKDGFYSAAKLFFEELDKLATAEFHANEITNEVFGENVFTEGEKAISVGNIDQIFQNVIVDSDGNWNIIDYEWTFDFAVPVKFIKYRSLLNFFINQTRSRFFSEYTGYETFGITPNEADNYFKIEVDGFQKWLNNAKFLNFSQIIKRQVLNPYKIEQSDFIDVFYDTGNGFSGEDKETFYQFPIAILLKENLRSVRIDPSAQYCIVSDISIKSGENELDFTTNAYMQKGSSYFFNTADSQIYIEPPKDGYPTLYVDMLVSTISEKTALEIEGQKSRIQEQDLTIQKKQQEIASVYSSRSWKLTKPLRTCGNLVRKILRKV